jgi:Protein of unknown function (DUF2807).
MPIIWGNGDIETEERFLTAFDSISMGGSGKLRVHRGDFKVTVTGDSNVLPAVSTIVSEGELKLGMKALSCVLKLSELVFDVSLPELSGLRIAGSGSAEADAFSGDEIVAQISGSGTLCATLDYGRVQVRSSGSGGFEGTIAAKEFELHLSGSGSAKLLGSAERADIRISGSGAVLAPEFATKEARLSASGSGRAELRAARSIDAQLSGSGELKYWGDPEVRQRVSGSGRVYKAKD